MQLKYNIKMMLHEVLLGSQTSLNPSADYDPMRHGDGAAEAEALQRSPGSTLEFFLRKHFHVI